MLRSLGGGQIKKKQHKNNGGQSQSFKNNNNNNNNKIIIIIIIINETRPSMIGSPERIKNSKKFSAKFKQNQTTSKNHRVFLNILGG